MACGLSFMGIPVHGGRYPQSGEHNLLLHNASYTNRSQVQHLQWYAVAFLPISFWVLRVGEDGRGLSRRLESLLQLRSTQHCSGPERICFAVRLKHRNAC
jgi:hypothetical protein